MDSYRWQYLTVMTIRHKNLYTITLSTAQEPTIQIGLITSSKTDSGNLWIATCLGGIFVVDKHKLMQSKVGQYVAEYNYSIHNGLSGMFINQIMPIRKVMYGYCYTTVKAG